MLPDRSWTRYSSTGLTVIVVFVTTVCSADADVPVQEPSGPSPLLGSGRIVTMPGLMTALPPAPGSTVPPPPLLDDVELPVPVVG
jgi:hypothetical protein